MGTGDTKDVFGLFMLSGALKVRDLRIRDLRAENKALTAENEALRARLETVEAETIERCARVAERDGSSHAAPLPHSERWQRDTSQQVIAADRIASAIRNLEPRHD